MINKLLDGYYSLRQKRVEIPLIWLTTGALLIVATILSVPAELDYSGVGPQPTSFFIALNISQILEMWGRLSVISLLSTTQWAIACLLRATLRSLFTALGTISIWIQQFIDEESTVPTSLAVIQGTTLVGSVTAVAIAATNQRPVLSTPVAEVEASSQLQPTLPILPTTHDCTPTEDLAVIDHDVTEIPLTVEGPGLL